MSRRLLPLAAGAAALLSLAGCSGDSAVQNSGAAQVSSAAGSGSSSAAGGSAGSAGAAADAPALHQANAPAVAGAEPLDIGRPQGRIERHVDATYRVPHGRFQDAFDLVINRAATLGGFVVDSSTAPDADGRLASGAVTVRIPAEKLSDFVSGLPGSFQVSSINYSSIDHTAQSVDLAAQLKAATGHRDALEQLLSKAQTIQDITALEDQISQVQQTIDQVQGQQDAVANAVDLSTARISLVEQDLKAAPSPSTSTFGDALHSGWSNAQAVAAAAVLAVVTALPLLVVAVLLLLGIWLVRRQSLLRRLLRASDEP